MKSCEFLKECRFINVMLKDMPATSKTIKELYCSWNCASCARYKVTTALGGENVPADLFPGDARRADDIFLQQ